MTQLDTLLHDGFKVMVSELVTPGTVFASDDMYGEGSKVLVFHPLDYSYASEPNFWDAHEANMKWIQKRIDFMAVEANARLDTMVYNFEHKNDPSLVVFMPNVEVTENADGTFTFHATAAQDHEMGRQPAIFSNDDALREKTYAQLRAEKGEEPTFDALVRGYN